MTCSPSPSSKKNNHFLALQANGQIFRLQDLLFHLMINTNKRRYEVYLVVILCSFLMITSFYSFIYFLLMLIPDTYVLFQNAN